MRKDEDFLWEDRDEGKEHLINWEMVSLTKEKWVCIINIVARIIAPLKKSLSRKEFSIEHSSL